MPLKDIPPESVACSVFSLIGKEWMLITAGEKASFNTMTAAWGGLGVLWDRNICFCFIRPSRYTCAFMERSQSFTLSFFEEGYRDVLNYCGTKSGRDVDKVAHTGLTPVFDGSAIYFAEARLVMICRKIYAQDLVPGNFLDDRIERYYSGKDYHRMYIGEVQRCLQK